MDEVEEAVASTGEACSTADVNYKITPLTNQNTLSLPTNLFQLVLPLKVFRVGKSKFPTHFTA